MGYPFDPEHSSARVDSEGYRIAHHSQRCVGIERFGGSFRLLGRSTPLARARMDHHRALLVTDV